MNPSGRSTYHPARDATSGSTSASTSRKVVWKGGITIRDENDELKTLQGLVFQAQESLPLHCSFYPPTPTSASHASNQITPPVGSLELEQAIFPSTPSAVATSSKVTLDTPFGGATGPEGSGNVVIDGILKCRQTKAFRLSHRTVEVPKLHGLRSKQEDLVDGVRVITSQSSTEAIRHIQSLLVPPKLKQPQALDSSGRTLRGIVLAAPVPDDHDPLTDAPPLLLLYGIKHTFPNDLKNKPRLLLFVTLYQPNPPKGTVLAARKRASLGMKPPATIQRTTTADDDDEERDPLPEPVKKRFKDRTGMGRGALLHHLPPPPPPEAPPAPAAKRKVTMSTGKGKEREGSLVAAVESAAEVGGAGKRRRVELDGEVGVQRAESSRVVEVVQEKVELNIEQMNRNTLRSEVSLALLARGVPSDHQELKTLGQWITRGAGFSLRETLTVQLLNAEDMSEAIESHLESYLPKEFKTTKPPRLETAESGSQTDERVVVEMSTQTVEVEVAVEPEVVMEEPAVEEDAPMEEDETPIAVEEQPSALEPEAEETTIVAVEVQEELVEEPSVEQEEQKDATSISLSELPTPITPSELPKADMAAPLPPTQPSPRRTRARPSSTVSPLKSAPATTSTQVEPVPSPSTVLAVKQDSDLTPTPSETEEEAVEEESETPTKTRSGRARVSNRGRKVVLSSPLKQSQVAKEPEEEVPVEESVAEVELEVVAPMEVEQVVEEVVEQPEEIVVDVVEEQQVEEPSQPEPTPIELAPPPPPLPGAARRTSSRRASAVGLPTPTEPALPLPALPSPIVEQLPTIPPSPPAAAAAAPSEPILPPPSSLPSPSSSQTPTRLPFRRTRSNRSALSSNHDASSPVTPQASTSLFAVEVEVVTPTASTSTSNKRTRGGSRKLQAGQPEKEQEKEKEEEEEVNKTPTRATRSRRGSVIPSESVAVEEAKVVKSKGKGKKVVKKGKAVEAEVEVEVEAEAVEQEQEQEMEGVVEESVEPVAVVEPVALEDELEEGEIREDDVPEAFVEQKEAPVVVEQEEMQIEVGPVVAAPQPPPSPARVALSESPSALRVNLDIYTTTDAVPFFPRLSNGLNKENESSLEVASVLASKLPPSLPKVADLPPSPPTSAKELPPTSTTQDPPSVTESEPAPPPVASVPISSSSSSLPPRPTPTSNSKSDFNSRLSSAGLPSKPAPQPIQVHRAAIVSPLPEPTVSLEEVSKLVTVSVADAGKKKKRSLPPLPSEYEDVDRKWKAGVIPSVKASSSKPVEEEDKEKVVVAALIQAPAPIVAADARRASLVKEVPPPTVVAPIVQAAAPTRPTAPPPAPKPVVALASLLAAYSSDDESEEDEPAPTTTTSVSPIIEVVASQQPSETVAAPPPKLVVDDFFVADEEPKAGSVERDPTMYYTDEDSDMRMEDGVGGVRIVKKGWF